MKKSVAIIGGGPAGLMLAAQLNEIKFDVTIYERNATLGRKFLVAGEGGLNITHSEETHQFISRYTPASFFEKIISDFTNTDLRTWLKSIGIDTYIGSSKRVFPAKGIKPAGVLNAILNILDKKNVIVKENHIWKGWEKENLLFENNDQTISVKTDITVFALGGASRKVTGSDGGWINYFSQKGIEIIPFQPSNCAYRVQWEKEFIEMAEGKPLKNVSISCGDKNQKGEVVITKFGLEGGAVYALSPQIREQLNENKKAEISIDLKSQFSQEQIREKISERGNRSITKVLADRLGFGKLQIELLKSLLTKEEFTNAGLLAKNIKNLPVIITGTAPIDQAISTVGGIALTEIDSDFQLKKMPHNYVIGEMLDWDAPTGGYLLQGCFSMGHRLGKQLNH